MQTSDETAKASTAAPTEGAPSIPLRPPADVLEPPRRPPAHVEDELRPLVTRIMGELQAQASGQTPFIGFAELCRYLPMYSPRTLRNWCADGTLPGIRPMGAKKWIFHRPSIDAAVLRFSRGGIE